MSVGISEDEIERELQTLRNLRRRSASSPGPGALAVDPDLPPPSPSPSSSSTAYTSNDDVTLATPDGLDDDGSLFWVPAHLHPELAPGEFKAFLKAHTSSDPEDGSAEDTGAAPGLARSGSWLNRRNSTRAGGADGLGRKRSMLSKQYQPRAGDAIDEEVPPMPTRNGRGSIYRGRGGEKGLTLQDLQRLETMVDRVEEGSDDPTQMRSMLRRSLSMNVAPGFLQDDVAQGDEDNQPVVLPRPGSIIRRTARTRIRKDHLPGDGGGRRFGASRRPRTSNPSEDDPSRRSSDGEEGGSDEYNPIERFDRSGSNESYEYEERYQDALETQAPQHLEHRRGSDETTDEGVIFDAYRASRGSSISSESGDRSMSPSPEHDSPPQRKLSLPPITPGYSGGGPWAEGEKTPTQESVSDPMGRSYSAPVAEEEPRGMRKVSGMKLEVPLPFDTPKARPISPTSQSGPTRPGPPEFDLPPGMAPPATRQTVPPGIALQHKQSQESLGPSPIDPRPPLSRPDSSSSLTPPSPSVAKEKEKEKKGGFFGKKDKKEKEKKKEKEGFLGSLFGGHKKKQEEVVTVSNFGTAGPAAAAALLGSSKSAKSMGHSPTPSPTNGGFAVNGAGNFARYPIHVERAVYRLSHIKLANARRPLYEQVLISNLMFWYLGVIGRNVGEEKKAEKEEKKEKKEAEPAKPPPAKGTPPKSLEGGQAGNGKPVQREEPSVPPPSAPAQQQTTLKKGLTKPERRRDGRDNEAAVRTPSYGMQNALVDSDLRAREARGESRDPREGAKGSRGMNGSPPPQQQPQQRQPEPQYQSYGPPPGGMPARSPSNPSLPNDPRGRQPLPPVQQLGGHQRPASDYGQPSPPIIREIQGAPRGVPQSSFGPPPPPNAGFDPARDPRQRTLSTPNAVPPPGPQGPSGSGQMRRVVTEGRPDHLGPSPPPPSSRSMAPSHSGPQPGQIFQYPGSAGPLSPTGSSRSISPQPQAPFPPRASSHPAPGQVFSPPPGSGTLPGQVFQHRPPNGHLPPPAGYNQHPPGPSRPLPEQWSGPQRLPPPQPGQQAPYPPPHHPQQHYQARPNFSQPPGPQQPFDPRAARGPPQPGQYPPPPGQGYAPPPGQYADRPPQLGAPVGPPQGGQGYNPYAQPPGQGGEFRRTQAVPGQYGHHR